MAVPIIDRQPVGERQLLPLVSQLDKRMQQLERDLRDLREWVAEIGDDVTAGMVEAEQRSEEIGHEHSGL